MDSVNNSMIVEALERALQITDKQRTVLTWSDKNQNKKKESVRIEAELAQLRLVLAYVKESPIAKEILFRDQTGVYRGRHEVLREVNLNWKERISALIGNAIKFRAVVLTEGVMGRVIEAAEVSVGTVERDIMKKKEEVKEEEDLLEKVVESEPLEAQIRQDGENAKEGGEGRVDTDKT